jgi:LIVCS family branched-chain amino acid:cation transporter
MSRTQFVATYSFAIFSMFFGSGNLIFPIQIGILTTDKWLLGFIGLFFTGVILPFLGLFVIKLYDGKYDDFFGVAGKLAKVALPFISLSLLGSCGVIPRCIAVSYGSVEYYSQSVPLWAFSLLFSIVMFFFSKNEHGILKIVGQFMGPVLLVILITLIISGVYLSDGILVHAAKQSMSEVDAFSTGFVTGYQMMDLLAAFFFSSLIFKQIQTSLGHNMNSKELIKFAVIPSAIGSMMLAIVYLGLVLLGAEYANSVSTLQPQLVIPHIAYQLFGNVGHFLVMIVIILSCMTTAIALNSIFAKYLCHLFSLSDNYYNHCLILTSVTSFLFSLLEFNGIVAMVAPILNILYPSLIVLTISCIFIPNKKNYIKQALFWITLTVVIFGH